MKNGDISNQSAPIIAFNCAAMFDKADPGFFNPFGKPKLRVNKFANEAHLKLRRMSYNRILLVEKPELWRAVEHWRDSPMANELEPTMMTPIFYQDHYATLRAQFNAIVITLWTGDNAPGYEEVINRDQDTGWSLLTDLAKQMEG